MSKYNVFGMETLNVTQSYNGTTSHKPHTTGSPKDYPIDVAGADGGQSALFAKVDMKVTAIRGVGNSATNTIWLVSTEKVKCPTFEDTFFMSVTHWNDNDSAIKKHNKVGDIIKAGEIICYEGTDGATANHLHISCGRGYSDNWTCNSNGKWVTTGNTMKPEDVFYIDRSFTKEKWGGYLPWIDKPSEEIKKIGTPVDRNTQNNQIEVIVDNLRARNKGTTTGTVLGYVNKGIYGYLSTNVANGYTWYQIEKDTWIASGNDWTIVYPAETHNYKDEQIAELERQLQEKDNTITDLNKKIDNLLIQIKDLEEKIKELESQEPIQIDESIFSYAVTKTDKYVIDLHDGEELKIYAK